MGLLKTYEGIEQRLRKFRAEMLEAARVVHDLPRRRRLLLLQAELDAIASVVSQIDNTFNAQLKESSSLASKHRSVQSLLRNCVHEHHKMIEAVTPGQITSTALELVNSMFEKQNREREAARIAAARDAELHPPPVAPTAPALQTARSSGNILSQPASANATPVYTSSGGLLSSPSAASLISTLSNSGTLGASASSPALSMMLQNEAASNVRLDVHSGTSVKPLSYSGSAKALELANAAELVPNAASESALKSARAERIDREKSKRETERPAFRSGIPKGSQSATRPTKASSALSTPRKFAHVQPKVPLRNSSPQRSAVSPPASERARTPSAEILTHASDKINATHHVSVLPVTHSLSPSSSRRGQFISTQQRLAAVVQPPSFPAGTSSSQNRDTLRGTSPSPSPTPPHSKAALEASTAALLSPTAYRLSVDANGSVVASRSVPSLNPKVHLIQESPQHTPRQSLASPQRARSNPQLLRISVEPTPVFAPISARATSPAAPSPPVTASQLASISTSLSSSAIGAARSKLSQSYVPDAQKSDSDKMIGDKRLSTSTVHAQTAKGKQPTSKTQYDSLAGALSAAVAASGSPLITRHRRYSSANSFSLGETELVPATQPEQVLLSAGEYGLHVRLISASDLELEKGQLMSADPLKFELNPYAVIECMEQSARTDVAWNQTAPQFTAASLSVKFPLSNDIVANQSSEQTFPLLISVWHTDKSDESDAALSWQSLGVAECDALMMLANNGQRDGTSELPSAIVTLPLSERGSVCVRVDVVPVSVYLEQQSQSEMQLLSAKCSNSLSPAQSRALWAQAISLAESSASIPPLALCLTFRLRLNSEPLASAMYATAIANALHLPVGLICANARRKDTHHYVDVRIVPDPVQAVAFPTAAGFATTLKRSIDEQFVAGVNGSESALFAHFAGIDTTYRPDARPLVLSSSSHWDVPFFEVAVPKVETTAVATSPIVITEEVAHVHVPVEEPVAASAPIESVSESAQTEPILEAVESIDTTTQVDEAPVEVPTAAVPVESAPLAVEDVVTIMTDTVLDDVMTAPITVSQPAFVLVLNEFVFESDATSTLIMPPAACIEFCIDHVSHVVPLRDAMSSTERVTLSSGMPLSGLLHVIFHPSAQSVSNGSASTESSLLTTIDVNAVWDASGPLQAWIPLKSFSTHNLKAMFIDVDAFRPDNCALLSLHLVRSKQQLHSRLSEEQTCLVAIVGDDLKQDRVHVSMIRSVAAENSNTEWNSHSDFAFPVNAEAHDLPQHAELYWVRAAPLKRLQAILPSASSLALSYQQILADGEGDLVLGRVKVDLQQLWASAAEQATPPLSLNSMDPDFDIENSRYGMCDSDQWFKLDTETVAPAEVMSTPQFNRAKSVKPSARRAPFGALHSSDSQSAFTAIPVPTSSMDLQVRISCCVPRACPPVGKLNPLPALTSSVESVLCLSSDEPCCFVPSAAAVSVAALKVDASSGSSLDLLVAHADKAPLSYIVWRSPRAPLALLPDAFGASALLRRTSFSLSTTMYLKFANPMLAASHCMLFHATSLAAPLRPLLMSPVILHPSNLNAITLPGAVETLVAVFLFGESPARENNLPPQTHYEVSQLYLTNMPAVRRNQVVFSTQNVLTNKHSRISVAKPISIIEEVTEDANTVEEPAQKSPVKLTEQTPAQSIAPPPTMTDAQDSVLLQQKLHEEQERKAAQQMLELREADAKRVAELAERQAQLEREAAAREQAQRELDAKNAEEARRQQEQRDQQARAEQASRQASLDKLQQLQRDALKVIDTPVTAASTKPIPSKSSASLDLELNDPSLTLDSEIADFEPAKNAQKEVASAIMAKAASTQSLHEPEPAVNTNSEPKYGLTGRYTGLVTSLWAGPDQWAAAIASVGAQSKDSTDSMLCALIRTYVTQGDLARLLRPLCAAEISAQNDATTLFRSASLCTRTLSLLCFVYGSDYLQKCIQPTMARLRMIYQNSAPAVTIQSPSNNSSFACEVDPAKEPDADRRLSAQQLIKDVCEDVLLGIVNSVKHCPNVFKIAARVLYETVAARFGDVAPTCFVGLINFFFLRFFCPAVAIPQGHQLWLNNGKEDAVPRPVSRILIHVSSLLQKSASMTSFKEGHMTAFNEWLSQNGTARITKFCKKIVSSPITEESEQPNEVSTLKQQMDSLFSFVGMDEKAATLIGDFDLL